MLDQRSAIENNAGTKDIADVVVEGGRSWNRYSSDDDDDVVDVQVDVIGLMFNGNDLGSIKDFIVLEAVE